MIQSWNRTLVLARSTGRELQRQRVVRWLAVVAAGLVLASRGLEAFHLGAAEARFVVDCGLGVQALFGAILALALATQTVAWELEQRTAWLILAKPVRRGEYLLGKLVACGAVLAGYCGTLTVLLLALVTCRELETAPSALSWHAWTRLAVPLLGAGLLEWLKLCVFSSLLLVIASLATTPLYTLLAGSGIYVACQLQGVAQDLYSRATTVVGRVAGRLATSVLPDFQVFSLAEPLGGDAAAAVAVVLGALPYAAGYVALGAGLAVLCLERREF